MTTIGISYHAITGPMFLTVTAMGLQQPRQDCYYIKNIAVITVIYMYLSD